MTDASKQELIEEAAKAILDEAGVLPSERYEEMWQLARRDAEAAFKVFEQAYTPTDDEREAARAYADAEYPELPLAPENEDRADIAERTFLAGARFRRTAVPTSDEREALARAVFIASDDFAFADRMAKAWDAPGPHGRARWYRYADAILAAGFRRTAVQEPTVRDRVRSLTGATDAELDELGGFQGEPSDAQVDAAYLAWNGARIEGGHTGFTAMRAALRAAAAVREEGQGR